MAETRAVSELTPELWDARFTVETYQSNPFSAYAGTGLNNPIQMREEFTSQRGNGISFSFITRLTNGAIIGRQPLRGYEEKLGEYGDKVEWQTRKNGVSIHEEDRHLASIDLRQAAREALRAWADEDVRDEVIAQLGAVGEDNDVLYDSASAAQKNTWHDNNSDRVVYGAATSNFTSNDHAASLANVDSTNDEFTKSAVSLMKRLAIQASPRIQPIRVQEANNRRYYVAFAHPYAFRDFVESLNETERQVSLVDKNRAIFHGGDREYDGVIVHEVDDMPIYSGVGAASIDVAPVYLVGQQAVGWAIGQRYRSRVQMDDYDQVEGIGMIGRWGMKKLSYRYGSDTTITGKQHGVVTGFYAAVGD